jgi:transcriptional regulator with XRE-family HTH domain
MTTRLTRPPVTYLDKVMTESGISNQKVADVCGVSVNAARQWRLGLYFPSVEYAKTISSTYGIPRHLLRPDIWDPPPGWKRPPEDGAGRLPQAQINKLSSKRLPTVKPKSPRKKPPRRKAPASETQPAA